VVIAFGQKLPRSLLEGRFAINLHASLLPRWRGAAPINAAILAGDTETGNSVITLADRMDAGQILGAHTRPIDPLMTAGELHDLLALDGPLLVERVLSDFAANRLNPVVQDENLVTIATKLGKSDDNVDYAQKADFVRRQVHALTPWPGVTAAIIPPGPAAQPGGSFRPIQIKVRRVRPTPGTHQEEPGVLLDVAGGIVALRLIANRPSRSDLGSFCPNAMTTHASAGIDRICSMTPGSPTRDGLMIGTPERWVADHSPIGVGESFPPRPAGLSGCVTTPKISCR
ncbi:MAG TPA: formyltransferase family protein, partial [Phycisphaerales bacterium]|nr:formyltransferase family protein [Phycisphaerales bacterium]